VRCSISRVPFQLSLGVLGEQTPMILNRAPVEEGAHLQSFRKAPVDEPPTKFPSRTPQKMMSVL
jgi:hypothetical protein